MGHGQVEEAGARRISVRVPYRMVSEGPLSILRGEIARSVERTLRMLCEWKGAEVLELKVMEEHVHVVVSSPPRLSVSELLGILKGKTAIKLFKEFSGSEAKAVLGEQVLEQGVLREHGGNGRREDPTLREVPRRERKTGRGRREGIWPLIEADAGKAIGFAGGCLLNGSAQSSYSRLRSST